MKYLKFTINSYRAIKGPLTIDFSRFSLVPLIGLNECGKTTILQAIFAFDHLNDDEYESRHIENTENLYDTKGSNPSITAQITGDKKEFSKILSEFQRDHKKELLKEAADNDAISLEEDYSYEVLDEDLNEEFEEKLDGLSSFAKAFKELIHHDDFHLSVKRNLTYRSYTIVGLEKDHSTLSDKFCEFLLSYLPYILYNDDFQDRPPSRINISDENSKWFEIYDELFKFTDKEYSLKKTAAIADQRRRNSIISDVEAELNRTLAQAWKSFHLDRSRSIKINLSLEVSSGGGSSVLSVNIVEKFGERERFFEVVDRSKGFLWFYNFVMKTEFNPKRSSAAGGSIYLLDEPGSYLHSVAQTKLCEKLRSISKTVSIVYCTHSPHLLSPESVPINNILIVEKSGKKRISTTRLPEYKSNKEKTSALQPVFEALQIDGSQFSGDPTRAIIAVEGIYDKYSLRLFAPNLCDVEILPGTGASSITKNIQFLNAFGRNYVALWDNDKEGRREMGRAKNTFGLLESPKFILLPSGEMGDICMEKMFASSDFEMFRKMVGASAEATYESLMVSLFQGGEDLWEKVRAVLSTEAKARFEQLENKIIRLLSDWLPETCRGSGPVNEHLSCRGDGPGKHALTPGGG